MEVVDATSLEDTELHPDEAFRRSAARVEIEQRYIEWRKSDPFFKIEADIKSKSPPMYINQQRSQSKGPLYRQKVPQKMFKAIPDLAALPPQQRKTMLRSLMASLADYSIERIPNLVKLYTPMRDDQYGTQGRQFNFTINSFPADMDNMEDLLYHFDVEIDEYKSPPNSRFLPSATTN